MSNQQQQIDDLLILGFSFTQQQLEDLHAAIIVALNTFQYSPVDQKKSLSERLHIIRDRIEHMIEQKRLYKY